LKLSWVSLFVFGL